MRDLCQLRNWKSSAGGWACLVLVSLSLCVSGLAAADIAPRGKIGIIGDSIAAGTHSSEMCRNQDIINCIQDLAGQQSREWSYAGGRQNWSIASMLGYPPARVVDASGDGEEWKDAFEQAVRIMVDSEVETVFIGLGANDVCQARGHNYIGDLDVVASFIDETLNYLTNTLPPGGSIYWSGVPNVAQLHELMRNRDHNIFFETCQATWDLDTNDVKLDAAEDACKHYFSNRFCETAAGQGQAADLLVESLLDTWFDIKGAQGPCGKILDSGSTDQDRLEARNFTIELNSLMARKAREWSGRNGIDIRYSDRIYNASPTVQPHHLSRIDCFHPSRSGQMKFAYEIWSGFNQGHEQIKDIFIDEFDSTDYCRQEFGGWGSCWLEANDDTAATSGDIQIADKVLSMRSGGKQISRTMNLQRVDQAWISFNRRRDNLDHLGDFVEFQISPDAGQTWQLLDQFVGESTDIGFHRGSYYDISAYATADTVIRFASSSGMGANDRLFFDNVKVVSWNTNASAKATEVFNEVALDGNWKSVNVPSGDSAPVVFMGVAGDTDGGAGLAAVKNVGANHFDVQLQELGGGGLVSEERVPYLVLRTGTYVMPDGSHWEVGRFDIPAHGTWQPKAFKTPFADRPFLFLSLQTGNNAQIPILRARAVATTGFEVALIQQTNGSSTGLSETAAYLAIHSPGDSGAVRIADTDQSYRLQRELLDGQWTLVFDTFLRLRDGGSGDDGISAETHDVLDLGGYVFAQQVSSSGTDLAVPQRIVASGRGINAAVLPASRSVQLGSSASAFAAIINAASDAATDCSIVPLTNVPADFFYQTTDPTTNAPVGPPNTPVDITAGGLQTYVIAFTPTAAFKPTAVKLAFDCSNSDPAPVISGVNTLLLSASNIPVPDILALAATPSGDGIVQLPGTFGVNALSVATANIGVGGNITVTADTGDAALPLTLLVCETDPDSGACFSPLADSVTSSMNPGATSTFTVVVNGGGVVPLNPVTHRIFVRFRDGDGVIRGSTSVAVHTQ